MSACKWFECMLEDDVERFTERSQERRQVFEDAASQFSTTELSPLAWALLQVGNLEQVKELVQTKVGWKCIKGSRVGHEARDAILLWKQKSMASPMAKTPTPTLGKRSFSVFANQSPTSPLRTQAACLASQPNTRSGKLFEGSEHSVRRAAKITKCCTERDNGLCVISGIGAVDACHIYPWSAFGGKGKGVDTFWEFLGWFWPEEKVKAWQDKMFRDNRTDELRGTETAENMLTLTSTLHRFHTKVAFALRPVRMSEDRTRLELEFHWLSRQVRDSSARLGLLEEPESSRGRKDSGKGYKFFRLVDAEPSLLVSGTRFTMTTDDAINKPLPDPGLLELQWHLQRILAMSGAAGWEEEDFDNEEPDAGMVPTTEEWVESQMAEYSPSRCSSPGESVEGVNGAFE